MSAATWVALAANSSAIWLTLWPWNEANRSIARWRTTAFGPRFERWRRWAASPVTQLSDEEFGPAGHRHLLRIGRLGRGVRFPAEHYESGH